MSKARKLSVVACWAMAALVTANMAWAAADPAPAAPMQVTGKVHAVDVVNQVIKMDGGQYYVVPASINLADIKEGDQLVLSGEKDATGKLQVKTVTKK